MNKLQELTSKAAKEVVAALKNAAIEASGCKLTAGFGKIMITGIGVHASINLYCQSGEEHFAYVGEGAVSKSAMSSLVKAFKNYVNAVASVFKVDEGFTPILHVSRNSVCISVGSGKYESLELSDLAGLNWHQPNFKRARRRK